MIWPDYWTFFKQSTKFYTYTLIKIRYNYVVTYEFWDIPATDNPIWQLWWRIKDAIEIFLMWSSMMSIEAAQMCELITTVAHNPYHRAMQCRISDWTSARINHWVSECPSADAIAFAWRKIFSRLASMLLVAYFFGAKCINNFDTEISHAIKLNLFYLLI